MDDREKELYDFAYSWFQGDNKISGADHHAVLRFTQVAQYFADKQDYQQALKFLLKGVWHAGFFSQKGII